MARAWGIEDTSEGTRFVVDEAVPWMDLLLSRQARVLLVLATVAVVIGGGAARAVFRAVTHDPWHAAGTSLIITIFALFAVTFAGFAVVAARPIAERWGRRDVLIDGKSMRIACGGASAGFVRTMSLDEVGPLQVHRFGGAWGLVGARAAPAVLVAAGMSEFAANQALDALAERHPQLRPSPGAADAVVSRVTSHRWTVRAKEGLVVGQIEGPLVVNVLLGMAASAVITPIVLAIVLAVTAWPDLGQLSELADPVRFALTLAVQAMAILFALGAALATAVGVMLSRARQVVSVDAEFLAIHQRFCGLRRHARKIPFGRIKLIRPWTGEDAVTLTITEHDPRGGGARTHEWPLWLRAGEADEFLGALAGHSPQFAERMNPAA